MIPGTGPEVTKEELEGTIQGVISWLEGVGDGAALTGMGLDGKEVIVIPNAGRAGRILHAYAVTRGIA